MCGKFQYQEQETAQGDAYTARSKLPEWQMRDYPGSPADVLDSRISILSSMTVATGGNGDMTTYQHLKWSERVLEVFDNGMRQKSRDCKIL